MNKDRREQLQSALDLISEAIAKRDEAKEIVEACATDERDGFDNLSEGLQQAERGQQMEANADALDEAVSNLEGLDFDDIVSKIEEAKG